MTSKIVVSIFLVYLIGCTSLPPVPPIPGVNPSPTPVQVEEGQETIFVSLPHMKPEWSNALVKEIKSQLANLNKASEDIKKVCPKYNEMNIDQQAAVWAYLSNAIIHHESGCDDENKCGPGSLYKTCSSMTESNGVDSIGFFQLSYGDRFAPKSKSEGSLCDPFLNMKVGVKLMGYFVGKDEVVARGGYMSLGAPPPKGLAQYWSVMRVPDRKSKHHFPDIMAFAAKAPGCV